MKIRIGDRDFEIILAPHGGKDFISDSSGKASHWYQKIYLDLDQRPLDGIESDLWHEIFEMIIKNHNFDFGHSTITTLALSIYQVLRDNKEFFDKFEEMINEHRDHR